MSTRKTILREAERITDEAIALAPEPARDALCGYWDGCQGSGHKYHLTFYVDAAMAAVSAPDYLLIDTAFIAIRWAVLAGDPYAELEWALEGLLRATDALGKMHGLKMAADAELAAAVVSANADAIASAERKRIALKANAAMLANDPKQTAKTQAKVSFIAWQDGTGEAFASYADFGRKMVARLMKRRNGKDEAALTDPTAVAGWCTKWMHELAQARSTRGTP